MHIQLTKENRFELSILLRTGHSLRYCADNLGFDHSAIIREVNRNKDCDGTYRPASAHRKMLARRRKAKQPYKKIINDGQLQKYIIRKIIINHWSPDQVSGRLRRECKEKAVCHETIYQWIYQEKPYLKQYLRCKKGKYRRKRGTKKREKQRDLAKGRKISERPEIVDKKGRIGDWEGDTIIGKEKKQRILTLNERVSGYLMADKLNEVNCEIVQEKVISRFRKIPKKKRHTLTRDNGSEMGGDDGLVEKKAKIQIYRAHAYCSCERGSNENTNGLLREFFPKRTYFANITQKDVDRAVRLLNRHS